MNSVERLPQEQNPNASLFSIEPLQVVSPKGRAYGEQANAATGARTSHGRSLSDMAGLQQALNAEHG